MYTDLFRFPMLLYRPSTSAMAIAIGVSLAAALIGSAGAVARAAGLPPAQAMNPPAPAVFVITSYSIHYTKLYEMGVDIVMSPYVS